jgi:hypothetical protein
MLAEWLKWNVFAIMKLCGERTENCSEAENSCTSSNPAHPDADKRMREQ